MGSIRAFRAVAILHTTSVSDTMEVILGNVVGQITDERTHARPLIDFDSVISVSILKYSAPGACRPFILSAVVIYDETCSLSDDTPASHFHNRFLVFFVRISRPRQHSCQVVMISCACAGCGRGIWSTRKMLLLSLLEHETGRFETCVADRRAGHCADKDTLSAVRTVC